MDEFWLEKVGGEETLISEDSGIIYVVLYGYVLYYDVLCVSDLSSLGICLLVVSHLIFF